MIFDNTPTEKIIEYLQSHPGKATGHIFITQNTTDINVGERKDEKK